MRGKLMSHICEYMHMEFSEFFYDCFHIVSIVFAFNVFAV